MQLYLSCKFASGIERLLAIAIFVKVSKTLDLNPNYAPDNIIKVTTYSMLLPYVRIVKVLLSCFMIPIATIFIATFIRYSLITFVKFHFSKVTGAF